MRRICWAAGLWVVCILAGCVCAEEQKTDDTKKTEAWKRKFNTGVSLTQSSYSNWAGGGENSVAWTVRFDGEIGKICRDLEWLVTSLMTFGQLKAQKATPKTTIDKIDVDGTVTWELGPHINPYVGGGLLTQFSKGYDYKAEPAAAQSKFWDPAYLSQSLGARIKAKEVMNSQLGVALKHTFTSEFTKYSDDTKTDKVEKYKLETGIQSTTKVNAKLVDNIKVLSKLELFSSFESIRLVDMRWDTLFTASLNKYIVLTLNIQINYDRDVVDKTQIKEVAGLGITYNLFD